MFKLHDVAASKDRRAKIVASLIVVASSAIVGLMSAAVARDDAGVRQFFLDQARGNEPGLRGTATPIAEPHLALTVHGPDRSRARLVASRKPQRKTLLAGRGADLRRAASAPSAARKAFARSMPNLFVSDPRQPAVVSIYEDRTLRRGDAVMTLAGLRVFAGSRTFPYRPEDFATLTASRTINGQLRRALIELDQSPALRG